MSAAKKDVLLAALNAHMQDNTPPKHITEAERTAWNAKSTFSGAYADLTGKPSIPDRKSVV